MSAVYIKAVRSQLAGNRVDNAAQAERLGKDRDFVQRRIGALSLPERSVSETAVGLAFEAVSKALETAKLAPSEIGALVFVSQNPDHGGLPHNSAELHGMLDLQASAMCFDVGLGCSGFVYGLSILSAIMQTRGITNALLVTSDQYRHRLKPDDPATQLLFGDAAAATVLSRNPGGLAVVATRLGTNGKGYEGLIRRAEGIAMNGRAIFSFSRNTIPGEIRALCEAEQVALDSIDVFLLHQGSRAIIEEIGGKLGVSPEKAPVDIEVTGNTVSSSLPLLLETRIEQKNLRRFILSGFGVGLSWGTALLQREDTR